MKNLVFSLLCTLFFTSCSTYIKDNCFTKGAYEMGQSTAKSWSKSDAEALAPKCGGNTHFGPDKFKEVYVSGYKDQLKLQCQKDFVLNAVQELVSNNRTDYELINFLKICKEVEVNSKPLEKVFKTNVAKNYCKKNQTVLFARKQANKLEKRNIDHLKFCYKKTRVWLNNVHKNTYNKALGSICSPVQLTARAIRDAKDNRELLSGVQSLNICPRKLRTTGLKVYKDSYYKETERVK